MDVSYRIRIAKAMEDLAKHRLVEDLTNRQLIAGICAAVTDPPHISHNELLEEGKRLGIIETQG